MKNYWIAVEKNNGGGTSVSIINHTNIRWKSAQIRLPNAFVSAIVVFSFEIFNDNLVKKSAAYPPTPPPSSLIYIVVMYSLGQFLEFILLIFYFKFTSSFMNASCCGCKDARGFWPDLKRIRRVVIWWNFTQSGLSNYVKYVLFGNAIHFYRQIKLQYIIKFH